MRSHVGSKDHRKTLGDASARAEKRRKREVRKNESAQAGLLKTRVSLGSEGWGVLAAEI